MQKLFGAHDRRAILGGAAAIGAVALLIAASSVFREKPRILLAPDEAVLSAPERDHVFRTDEGVTIELDLDKLGGEEVPRRAPMPQPRKLESGARSAEHLAARAQDRRAPLTFFGFLSELVQATRGAFAQDDGTPPEPNIIPPQDILPTARNPVVAQVVGPNGRLTDIEPMFVTANNKVRVSIPEPQRHLRPGRYLLRIWTLKGRVIYYSESSFLWGVLVVNSDKSIYTLGDTAELYFGVLDDAGRTLCDAEISATITAPSGAVTTRHTGNGTITKSSACGPTSITNLPDYAATMETAETGVHQITVTAITPNGTREISDAFNVQDPPQFDVQRVGPSRIYPPSLYAMTLRIRANADFTGDIVETVPAGFIVNEAEGMRQEVDGEDLRLIWNVALAPGETRELSYTFDAPDISPELYKLGPLTLGTWKEYRQWQIASDAVNAIGRFFWGTNSDKGEIFLQTRSNTDSWSATTTSGITPTTTNIIHLVARRAPTRDEAFIVTVHSSTDVAVTKCVGSCDAAADFTGDTGDNFVKASVHNGATFCNAVLGLCTRPIDVNYEQLSGDGLVVFATSTAGRLLYCTYSSGAWSGSNCATPSLLDISQSSGRFAWVNLVAQGGEQLDKSRTNRILLTAVDANADAFAAIWNGSTWISTTTLSNTSVSTTNAIAGAWEAAGSERALVVFASSTSGTTSAKYATWSQTSSVWSASTTVGTFGEAGILLWTQMASNPKGDHICLATHADNDETLGWIWRASGTTDTFTSGNSDLTGAEGDFGPAISCAWEKQNAGAANSSAVFVLTDQSTSDVSGYYNWRSDIGMGAVTDMPSSTLDDATQFTPGGVRGHVNGDTIMAIQETIDCDVFSSYWSATTTDWGRPAYIQNPAGAITGNDNLPPNCNNQNAGFEAQPYWFYWNPHSAWSRNWRWYTTVSSTDPSVALAGENVTPTTTITGDIIQLRAQTIELAGGPDESDARKMLQWVASSTCPDPDNCRNLNWTDVADATNTTAVWRYASSSETCATCTDGAILTALRLSNGVGTSSLVISSNATPSSSMDFVASSTTETAWNLVAQDPTGGETYFFRIFDVTDNTVNFRQQDTGTTNCLGTTCTYPSIKMASAAILTQNDFRWFANTDTAQPGSGLAIENATATVAATSTKVRLRMNINASSTGGILAASSESFKLQWSTSTTGNWSFVGGIASSTGAETSSVYTTNTSGTTWTVPTGTASIVVKAWGAGGGGGESEDDAVAGNGGGGGFVSGTIAVTAGTDLTIVVGGGGSPGSSNTDAGSGGGGGGYSAVLSPTSTIWIQAAGGGGGGGGGGSAGEDGGAGGAGGGASGTNGIAGNDDQTGGDFGNGGSQSAGGSGGSGAQPNADGAAGSANNGGGGGNGTTGSTTGGGAAGGRNGGGSAGCAVCATASASGAGGGGAGKFGGGGGESGSGEGGGGGGGGSSGFNSFVTTTSTNSGSGITAGASSSVDYAGNAGRGGTGHPTAATAGTDGRVVIRYSTTTEPIPSIWNFYDNSSVGGTVTLTSTLQLTDSDVGETYEEQNPTGANPNAITPGQDGEWDFSLDPADVEQTTYYFRMVKSDDTELDYYENYPAITFGEVAGENAPTVTNVVLNNGNDITLIPNATTSVTVSFTVEDADGCEDVFTNGWVTSTIFRTGVSSTCQATGPATNSLNCYFVATTTNSCSGGTNANATTTFGVYYFAQATDASSSYSAESWQAFVQVKDAAGTGGGWWNSSWLNRKKITLAPSSTATLTDFPILVQLNSSTNIDHAKTKSAGEDIRFVDSDDSTELSYEMEQWNENATSTFWVKVPSLATGTADYIYMYYNNSGATTSTQSSSTTWNSGYDVVWHMASSTSIRDSTGDDNPTLPSGWSIDTTGKFGTGLNWASSTTNGNDVTTGFNEGQDFSLEFWLRASSPASAGFDDAYVFHGNVWDGVVGNHLADPPTKLDAISYSTDHSDMFTTDFGSGAEDHFMLTEDWNAPAGGQVKFRLYKNGVFINSSTQTQGATQGSLFLGGDVPYQLGADIDEFRLSNTVRDGDWVTATYRSMTGQMTTYETEESPSSPYATSTLEELNTLVALNVLTSSINYGTIFPSSTTGSTNQITNIANAGNASATLRLSALQTLLFNTNIIPTSSQRYGTSTFTFPGLAVQLTDVATAVTSFFLTAPTSTANVTSTVYWGLEVPIGMPTGTYSGTTLFTGVWAP